MRKGSQNAQGSQNNAHMKYIAKNALNVIIYGTVFGRFFAKNVHFSHILVHFFQSVEGIGQIKTYSKFIFSKALKLVVTSLAIEINFTSFKMSGH